MSSLASMVPRSTRPLQDSFLGDSYHRTGEMIDLEQAIKCTEDALVATPGGDYSRTGILHNLGNHCRDRYIRTAKRNDLEQVIRYARQALAVISTEHPDRAAYLYSLGVCIGDRYYQTNDEHDDPESVQLLQDGANCSTSLPLDRIVSGMFAIQMFCWRQNWKEAAAITKTLSNLLPYLCSRYLSGNDQLYALKLVFGFAADACSLSLKMNSSHEALQRIEFDQALVLGYMIDGRGDISALTRVRRDLVEEYNKLRFQAFGMIDIPQDSTARNSV